MKPPAPAFLAWRQLIWSKVRFFVALAGIAFAVTLMLVQVGFLDALATSAATFHMVFDADIVLVDARYNHLKSTSHFSRRYLFQALGHDGVASVKPFYIGEARWRNPWTDSMEGILVVGIDPDKTTLNVPGILNQSDLLRKTDVVLFDLASQAKYGPVPREIREGKTVAVEVNGKKVRVEGLFRTQKTFYNDGNLVTSDANFQRLFQGRTPGAIDVGLVKLKPGADKAKVKAALAGTYDGILKVMLREEAVHGEKQYWKTKSVIGFIFNMGAVMGFIVGLIIVYQILFSDVQDHLAEYATLKAIGYSDTFLFLVILYESIILAFLGFIPGWGVSVLLYAHTARSTSLPIEMTVERAAQALFVTVVMCAISGCIALRKIKHADPADIF
jgi:putative ABC transport system permease protein